MSQPQWLPQRLPPPPAAAAAATAAAAVAAAATAAAPVLITYETTGLRDGAIAGKCQILALMVLSTLFRSIFILVIPKSAIL